MPTGPGLHAAVPQTGPRLSAIDHGKSFGAPKRRAAGATPARKTSRAKRQVRDLPVKNHTTTATYNGAELRATVRPGSQLAFTLPSRVGNRLHFPDGRMTDLQGNRMEQ